MLRMLCVSPPYLLFDRRTQKKQIRLVASGFELASKRTRKREFLDEMNLVELVGLMQPHAPARKTGRLPFAVESLLRIHFMQQWFALSNSAMEKALCDTCLPCEFERLDSGVGCLPEGSIILSFVTCSKPIEVAPSF